MTMDMTRGKSLRLMIRFAFPLILSSMLQQFYSMFDSVIVGRLLGADAFAAVGSCSNLNWFPLSMVMGLTQGFGVLYGQRFGAGDATGFRRAFVSGLMLATLTGLLLSVVGVSYLTPILTLLKTPQALMADGVAYLRVLWLGLALTAMHNAVSTALNALGDSRTPLMALCLSTVLNIALDYLFLATFGMGVEGAAWATLISQLAALAFCFARLWSVRFARPQRGDWRPRAATLKELLRLGLPLMLSYGVTSTGDVAVQAAVNMRGLAFVTGMTASRRYFSLLNIIGYGLEGALATFVAQNAGAKLYRRVIDGTRTAVWLGIGSSLFITAAVLLAAHPLILLFLPSGDPEAVRIGVDALRVQAVFVVCLDMLCLHRAAIQGTGNSLVPMLSGFLELALRLAAVVLLPLLLSREGLYFIDGFTWTVTGCMLMACYYGNTRKRLERDAARTL